MPLFSLIDDFSGFVRALTDRYTVEDITHGTGISIEKLEQWRRGGNHYRPQEEWLLYGFCVNRQDFDLLGPVLPTFDRQGPFDLAAPPVGANIEPPHVQLCNRPTKIAGHTVNFPFGISASILTRNAKTIAFYAARGFDILTSKTVRSIKRDPHPTPYWVFIRSNDIDKVKPPFEERIVGEDRHYWPNDPRYAAMANSFGIPSPEPGIWQREVAEAKQSLHAGQILIVSVTASPTPGDRSEKTLIDDFVRVAVQAKEAGADIVEANYSCPNTPGDPTGELYQDLELSGKVSAAIARALADTPLFVKIGYLDEPLLAKFVRHNRAYIRGIVAINTISMSVVSPSGAQLFPGSGRERAGIYGVAIRPWAHEVVRNLVAIREQEKAENEFAIIAVGGVNTSRDIYDYLNLGADAVESCTAAYLNPYLAIETRLQLSKLKGNREVSFRIEGQTKPIIDPLPIYADENARIADEIGKAVDRLATTLPPEGPDPRMQPITFDTNHKIAGWYAVFFAGTVVATDHEDVFLVPERTLKALDALGIPYRIAPLK